MRRAVVAFACLFYCLQPAVAIVGGAAQTNGDPVYHVVSIAGSDGGYCSGTVLTRAVVLTVAQCIHAGQNYKIFQIDFKNLSTPISVTQVVLHPNFDLQRLLQHLATVDLALLKVSTPLPLAITNPSYEHSSVRLKLE